MASKRYEIIRIRFTDGQTVYDWPILKSSLAVAVRILTAAGYIGSYTIESYEPQRNHAVPEQIYPDAGADAQAVKR